MSSDNISSKIKPDSQLRKRFGEYLIERNIVDTKAVEEALVHQIKQTTLIGRLAYTEKLMTLEKVFKVLKKQQGTNRRFGDIAVEMNFISTIQVQALLEKQQLLRPKIGESLVQINALENSTLKKHLAIYLKR